MAALWWQGWQGQRISVVGMSVGLLWAQETFGSWLITSSSRGSRRSRPGEEEEEEEKGVPRLPTTAIPAVAIGK